VLLWAFWTKDASTVFYFAGPRLSFSPLQQIAWIGSRVAVFWWSISHICQKLVNSRVLRFLLRDSLPSCIFKASQALENVVRKGEHIVSTKYSVSNYCGASSFIISFRSHTKRDSRHSEFLLFVWDVSLQPPEFIFKFHRFQQGRCSICLLSDEAAVVQDVRISGIH
jgi:hypothetical protein